MQVLSNMLEIEILASSVFAGQGHVQHTGATGTGKHALERLDYIKQEEADLKNVVAPSNLILLATITSFLRTDDGDTSFDISDELKQVSTDCSSGSDPMYLELALSNVVIEDEQCGNGGL